MGEGTETQFCANLKKKKASDEILAATKLSSGILQVRKGAKKTQSLEIFPGFHLLFIKIELPLPSFLAGGAILIKKKNEVYV